MRIAIVTTSPLSSLKASSAMSRDTVKPIPANAPIEIVVPKATIFSEHPALMIDRNVKADKRPVVQAFLNYLWSDEAQKAFVKYYFRSVTNDSFNAENPKFAKIEQPFTVDMFGGWAKAYPEVIEQVFRDQVQNK